MSFYRQRKESKKKTKKHIPAVVATVKKYADCGLGLTASTWIILYPWLHCCWQMEKWFRVTDLTH